jgi:uncharacterized protein YqgC (DUF456 family)
VEFTPLLYWLLALLLVTVGLAGTVLPALPGVPLIFVGLWLAAWIDDYQRVGGITLGVLGGLTVLAILADLFASVIGAQRVRASPQAIWGALIGSLVGLFFGLPGLLLGPFLGAMAGELVARGGLARATEVGLATWVGLLIGTILKLAIAVTMVAVFAFAWLV